MMESSESQGTSIAKSLEINALETALLAAFEAVGRLHLELGSKGQQANVINQFGEQAVRLDLEAEEVIISSLKSTGLSFRVVSEEHGEFQIGENPKLTATIDGLDGSLVYKEQDFSAASIAAAESQRSTGSRYSKMYGTMVAIHAGVNHCLKDYVVAGQILLSPQQQIFLASKGLGCKLLESGREQLIQSDKSAKNTNWKIARTEIPKKAAGGMKSDLLMTLEGEPLRSMAAGYADILNGQIDFFVDWTRKNSLEQSIAYGLLKEAGAAIVTLDAKDIGDLQYDYIRSNDFIALLTVRSSHLVEPVLELLRAPEAKVSSCPDR